jgi:branched-subunit amino acid transport protein
MSMILFWTVLGMGLVTYLPRMLPIWLGQKLVFSEGIRRWLSFVPFAVLGALIFPGVLHVDPARPWVGFVAGILAGLIALRFSNVILVVVGAIFIVYLLRLY